MNDESVGSGNSGEEGNSGLTPAARQNTARQLAVRRDTCTRRMLLARCGAGAGWAAAGLGLWAGRLRAADPDVDGAAVVNTIADAEIRAGVTAAIDKNLLPAATETQYPGYFTINADGGGFGSDTTWPGLDSWQLAGAYLLIGRTRLVLDYFEFVRAAQRNDGNIPFAIFPGNTRPGGCLRGLKSPDDLFHYTPPQREGLPASSQQTRAWIGLFEHWQTQGYPLGTLGPICYLLTAAEIFDATGSGQWLRERLPSLETAANSVSGRTGDQGLIGSSGFYTEAPPREGCDGVTQCYTVFAFRELARLFTAAGQTAQGAAWSGRADQLAAKFVEVFWREDHFGEYLHPRHGLVDLHGLSDVNWAAVALGVVAGRKLQQVWERVSNEPGFWLGDMPTQTVTRPFSYEKWETSQSPDCSVAPLNDVAAMGRAWYLETVACKRMRAHERLIESTRKVCRAASADGYWRERYHPTSDGTVTAAGTQKYCEYAAVLVRTVFANQAIFCR